MCQVCFRLGNDAVVGGKSAFGSLFVETWEVVPCLLHHFYHLVEGNSVEPVGEGGEGIAIQCTGGSKSIALDARDLHQTTYRVAGET